MIRADLGRFLRQARIPTLLVTHERTEALSLGEDVIVIELGRVLQHGPIREVFSRPISVAAAEIVGIETVQPGRVQVVADGLASVLVGAQTLKALAQDLPAGTTDVYVCIRAEDVVLASGELPHTSPRNSIAGVVTECCPEGEMLRIELDCGFPMRALLTRQAVEELGIMEGKHVQALIKAPHVHLIER
jgi:molybdate transport system ATP-binding protein